MELHGCYPLLIKWILYVIIFSSAIIQPATSQRSVLNTPPVMSVDRNWRISETEEVGSIIARVRAEDAENDHLQFGLEPLYHGNYASTNNNEGTTNDKLPFWINSQSGIVYLNESLLGRGNENFFLYITVYDGQLTAKNEVYVNILPKNTKNLYSQNSQTPINGQHNSQNMSQFFPPFYSLPGVQSVRNHPNNPRQPSEIFNGSQPPTRTSDIINTNQYHPGYSLSNQNINPLLNSRPTSSVLGSGYGIGNGGTVATGTETTLFNQYDDYDPDDIPATAVGNSGKVGSKVNNNGGGGGGSGGGMPTRTKLTPININIVKSVHDGLNTTTNATNPTTPNSTANNNPQFVANGKILNSTSIGLAATFGANGNQLKNSNQENSDLKESEEENSVLTLKGLILLIITIGGICLAIVLIGIVIYRKRLCAIGKSLKKKSKEEMAKKSNQSNLSSNITDDSRNSMVLQHWNGPTAFGNRYVPWERDNQQLSMATSQLSTSCTTGETEESINGNGGTTTNIIHGIGNGGSVLHSQLKTDRWEFPRHRLKFFNILGEGAFGQVWRCEATDIDGNEGVTTVAVKTLKENAAEVERNDLYSELQVMKSLEPHVNVVRLLGCCNDKDPIFVIIEYVNRGKLQTYLRNSRAERHYGNTHGKSNILTSGDLTSFMYQVAKGMDYLTSRGIIHRDLAARNILITDDHTCKVADFGFARDIVTSKIYERKSEGKLPIRWMATESLYDNIFSIKSDIWSFGILMWEIVTLGSTPYPGISAADVMRKVRDGYRLEKPEHCRRELYNIMFYCWADNSNERPSFSEIVLMLDKLLHTEMDYIELERFPDHNYYNILNLSGEKL